MQKIEFTGSLGETLAARLDAPESGDIRAYALFAHCFTCTKDIFAAGQVARALNNLGIAVLRFDFTGLGASEGEFENTNFTSNVQDLIKAADYMREELEAPSIIIGHSLGGAAVLMAAGQIPEVKAVATIAAPADAAHVTHHFDSAMEEIEANGKAEVCLVGRPFTIQKQFVDDLNAQNMDDAIRGLKKALLVLHAPMDATVGIENAEHIFKTAKHPKSFVSLDDADHLLSRKEDALYAARVIAGWASKYAGYKLTDIDHHSKGVKEGDVLVRTSGRGKFQNYVQMGRHFALADEPAEMGGDDTGPAPYDYLLAALGNCTNMTMKMYADHKGLALEGTETRLSKEGAGADIQIKREIVIKGDALTDENRAKLMEIANKCPVHTTLHTAIDVVTTEKSLEF